MVTAIRCKMPAPGAEVSAANAIRIAAVATALASSHARVTVPAEGIVQTPAEGHAAPAEHQESRDHDPRVPGVGRREPADLQIGSGITDLTQRADRPRAGEDDRSGDAGHCADPGGRPFHHSSVQPTCFGGLPASSA